ncbi:uncharacterized protein LOC106651434 [Trichogramma pretiosum]|uniref:uncharacterized protein LOC106651434 n=1 Tax=Trichogramma pretiosum TaxID=7493 RepID=UPI0006C94A2D|nr:uncharacterized protein LOC106651434 [Trichogramma pretiosum]XP_014225413.1 uncharacterized protein LOC106651434 [Trichogramma pretiosum]
MLQLLLLGLRSMFVSANDAEDVTVEDAPNADFPGMPGGKMPTADELLKMLDSMTGLSDEDKENLRRDLLKQAAGALPSGSQAEYPQDEGFASRVVTSLFASQFLVLMVLLSIIALIFVFFGYKLYKSLSEREKKREEKKKNKQLKKKK